MDATHRKLFKAFSPALLLSLTAIPSVAADSTQTITMDYGTKATPPCATVGTGTTTVTLTINNIPTTHTLSLKVDRYNIPAPDGDSLPTARLADQTKTQTFTYSADNTYYYNFTLEDADSSGTTKMRWRCGFDDTLSLSVGTMFTELPYRTYGHQKTPTAAGVQDLLVVSGNGPWTPQGVGLLNYKLYNQDKGLQFGVSLSSGPVFKFGGTPGVSNFGWFAGASVSIWHRLFLTPGIHIGEFADFPAGFGNYTPIPANFGDLSPVKRWSGRFGFALTYRINALVKSNASTKATSTTTPASDSNAKKK